MNQFKRLTIPSLSKETTLKNDGFFSTAHLTSPYIEDQITPGLPALQARSQWTDQNASQSVVEDQITLDLPAMPYENQWAHLRNHINTSDPFLPGIFPNTPRLTLPSNPRPSQSNGHNGHNGSNSVAFQSVAPPFVPDPQIDKIISAIIERGEPNHTIWEGPVFTDTQSKSQKNSIWAFFLELPHLLLYMAGALAIAGLYLIIPLLNLLNATVPGNLSPLLIALGIIVSGELLVCFILSKTIPRRKVKKGSVIAQP